jgi:hypothetical protein
MGRISFVLYVVVLGLLCLEVVGVVLFFRQSHQWIYANAGSNNDPTAGNAGRPIDVGGLLHPYFGYVQHEQPKVHVNNFGFLLIPEPDGTQCCDFPYVPKADEIVIAVLGGSVPEQLAVYFAANDNLLHALSDYPAFQGKKLKILELSQPGFKQPQSAIVLSYFLSIGQHVDIAITLDGRNELFVPMENQVRKLDYTWPVVWWDVAKSLDRLNASSDRGEGINIAYQGWRNLRYAYKAAQCRTGTCFVAYGLLAKYYGWREKKLIGRFGDVTHSTNFFGGDSGDHPAPLYTPSLEQVYDQAADFWARSARNMAALAQANGVTYLHFLQPLRHYGKQDAVIADGGAAADIPIKLGYPIMEQRVVELRKEGYNIFDYTEVFGSATPDSVYMDDCCHFGPGGKKIMTERIAAEIGSVYRPHKAP